MADQFVRNEEFEEVPVSCLDPKKWKVVLNGQWKYKEEHITLKEARSLLLVVRRLSRSSKNRGRKHLVLVDNMALAFSAGKGRSCNHAMLRLNQKIGALLLAANLAISVRWIPSELNVADAPSRGSNVAGYIKEGKVVSDFKHILSKEGEAGDRISGHAFVPQGEEEGEASGGEETESCREKAGYQPSHRGGRNSWEESAAREAYNAGEKQYQCRAGESVPPLPEQLQGLLCGERIKVPSKIRHRPDPRRLLRHSVSRQQKCSRRRKDPGSLGVPVSQLERQASPQQTGLEGVEKTSSPKIQASLAQTCGVRDSYETAAARSSRDGTSSPPELRHVPQTGGDVRPLSEKSGEPGSWDGATIQDVHLGDPRPRGRGARQDRSIQQPFESGQSGDSDLAGAHVEEFGEKSDAKRCALQLSGGQVPEGISKGRILSWVAVTSSVPAASRRGVRRLVQRSSRSCRSQRPWQMADRQFSQKICQDREDSKPVAAVARVEPQLLPPVNGQDGSSVEGDHTPPEHLNHDNNWREATGEFCLEIFAGCRRLTRALQKRGLRCYSIDVCLDPHDDVLDPDVEKKIFDLLFNQKVQLVWLGMPCTTFSRARRWDGIGPPPLRDANYVMGIPWLRGRERAKLITGNNLYWFSMRILWACLRLRIPVVLENPETSLCWQTPILQVLQASGLMTANVLHFCQFGEAWKKPTTLLAAFVDLSSVCKQCQGTFQKCSHSGRRHIPLKGLAPDGRFMTLIAQPYPFQLVAHLADIFHSHLTRSLCG